mmetsp:Transcript_71186/g.197121  ORF Transcript_71186/g.197121 Transcript_71186/m.197121 type:complete len:420 (+) Transcript_71186:116-1375(+)
MAVNDAARHLASRLRRLLYAARKKSAAAATAPAVHAHRRAVAGHAPRTAQNCALSAQGGRRRGRGRRLRVCGLHRTGRAQPGVVATWLSKGAECPGDLADVVAVVVGVPHRVLRVLPRQLLAPRCAVLHVVRASGRVVRGLVDQRADLLVRDAEEEVAEVHIESAVRVLLVAVAASARVDVGEDVRGAGGAGVDEGGVGEHVVHRVHHHLDPLPRVALQQGGAPEEQRSLVARLVGGEGAERNVQVRLRLAEPPTEQLLLLVRAQSARALRRPELDLGVQGRVDAEELRDAHGHLLDAVGEGGHRRVAVDAFVVVLVRLPLGEGEVRGARGHGLDGLGGEVQVARDVAAAGVAARVAGPRQVPAQGLQERRGVPAEVRARRSAHGEPRGPPELLHGRLRCGEELPDGRRRRNRAVDGVD